MKDSHLLSTIETRDYHLPYVLMVWRRILIQYKKNELDDAHYFRKELLELNDI